MERFNKLKEDDKTLKIDKDLIEIQKTIMYYGDSIKLELDKISTLVRTMLQQQDKGKIIETLEKVKITDTIETTSDNKLVLLIKNMQIPKGYKGNDQYRE